MHDALGRTIQYLRLSLTSECSMRCLYCRPAMQTAAGGDALMTADEIERLVAHLIARHGLTKVRLTGGEPTTRHDLLDILHRLGAMPGLSDLAMTTNGLTLAGHARRYREAGLRRVNVSLDSLDAATFGRITGVAGLSRVLRGIDAAMEAGLSPVRLNTVVLAGENDAELPALVRFAAARGLEIRFIELMPMGPLAGQWAQRYVPEAQMRRRLDAVVERWEPLQQGPDSARRFRLWMDDGSSVLVGFITPMSCHFCASCNRLRLTADGRIYPCLMDQPRGSFLSALRPRFDGDRLDRLLADALIAKASEHPAQGVTVMTTIGG